MHRIVLIAAGFWLAACSRDINNAAAVRQGVIDYLSERKAQIGLDPNVMQVDISSLSFSKDEAQATVTFRPKGTPTEAMSVNYTLERKGSKWVVKSRRDSGGSPHGAEGLPQIPQLPPGHPPTGAAK